MYFSSESCTGHHQRQDMGIDGTLIWHNRETLFLRAVFTCISSTSEDKSKVSLVSE